MASETSVPQESYIDFARDRAHGSAMCSGDLPLGGITSISAAFIKGLKPGQPFSIDLNYLQLKLEAILDKAEIVVQSA